MEGVSLAQCDSHTSGIIYIYRESSMPTVRQSHPHVSLPNLVRQQSAGARVNYDSKRGGKQNSTDDGFLSRSHKSSGVSIDNRRQKSSKHL